ncbi:MAG: hypothetical protein H8E03_00830 [Pelagibacteraceae bacterium]|nr:hypothetical protein [Pelagibacteraceae bacterium]
MSTIQHNQHNKLLNLVLDFRRQMEDTGDPTGIRDLMIKIKNSSESSDEKLKWMKMLRRSYDRLLCSHVKDLAPYEISHKIKK